MGKGKSNHTRSHCCDSVHYHDDENEEDYGGDPLEPILQDRQSASTAAYKTSNSCSSSDDENHSFDDDNPDYSDSDDANDMDSNSDYRVTVSDSIMMMPHVCKDDDDTCEMEQQSDDNDIDDECNSVEYVRCSALQQPQTCNHNTWVMMDSGAQRHIFRNINCLSTIVCHWPRINLITADNGVHRVRAIGNINKILQNVFIFERAGQDLISTSALARAGYFVLYGPVKMQDVMTDVAIIRCRDNKLLAIGELINGLYYVKRHNLGLPTNEVSHVVAAVMPIPSDPVPCSDLYEAHRKMGHLSLTRMKLMVDDTRVHDTPITQDMIHDAVDFVCPTCIQANIQHHMTRHEGTGNRFDGYSPGEVYALDFNTGLPESLHGKCVKTLMIFGVLSGDVYYFHYKSVVAKDVFNALYNIMWDLKRHGKVMKLLCHDLEGIFVKAITDFSTTYSVDVQVSSPYVHQQNGSAESIIKHDTASMRALLLDAGFNGSMWTYALECVAYIRNRSPVNHTISAGRETPFELIRGQKPTLKYIRAFGERVIVKLVENERGNKATPAGALGVIVGYHPDNPSAYGIMFCEQGYPVKFRNEIIPLTKHLQGVNKQQLKFLTALLGSPAQLGEVRAADVNMMSAEQPMEDNAYHSTDINDVYRDVYDNVYASTIVTCVPVLDELAGKAQFSLHQARKMHEAWPFLLDAMIEEWTKLQEFSTFKMISNVNDDPLASDIVTPLTIFFKVSRIADDDDNVKVKCRIALRGDTLNRDEIGTTASPTVSTTTVRLMLSFAAMAGLLIRKFDVVSAYLHAEQPVRNGKRVTCRIPAELIGSDHDMLAVMNKALYGDPEAGRQFYLLLRGVLYKIGFRASSADTCLYLRRENDDNMTFLITHVDDMLLLYHNQSVLDSFQRELSEHLQLKNEGVPKKFLGLYLDYDDDGSIMLSQLTYEKTILKRATISNRVRHVPLMHLDKYKASGHNREPIPEKVLFEKMGLFRYICDGVRPDLMFACSRAMSCKDGLIFDHMTYYLRNNIGIGLCYLHEPIHLHAYSDASYNIDSNGTSQLGYAVFLTCNSAAFAFNSKKIVSSTPLSSTEAELIAAVECWKTIRWTVDLLAEFDVIIQLPIPIYVDNGAIECIANDYQNRPKMRHLVPKIAVIRQAVADGFIVLSHVPSADNCADILTKPVQSGELFDRLLNKIIGYND